MAVRGVLATQNTVALASGSEAVATVAAKLMNLTPNQRAFLRLRSYFETDAACAKSLGIARKTVATWKARDTRFAEAYEHLLTQPLLHARAELVLLTQKAIHTISELMDGGPPQQRLAAAEKVLKARDAQVLTSNVKVEADDGSNLYMQLLSRLAARNRVSTVEPAVEEAVEVECRELADNS